MHSLNPRWAVAAVLLFLFLEEPVCARKAKSITPKSPWLEWSLSVGIDARHDDNISDSWTQVEGTWASPWLSGGIDLTLAKDWNLAWRTQARVENQVDDRSPTLNAPIDRNILSLRWGTPKGPRLTALAGSAGWINEDWHLVKYQYRIGSEAGWRSKPIDVDLSFRQEWELYGEDTQDGDTRLYGLDFTCKTPAQWGKRAAMFRLIPSWSLEDRRAQSTAYTYVDNAFGVTLSVKPQKGMQWNLGADRHDKRYADTYLDFSAGKVQARHTEGWTARTSLSITLGDWEFGASSQREENTSNKPGSSWGQHQAEMGIGWNAKGGLKH